MRGQGSLYKRGRIYWLRYYIDGVAQPPISLETEDLEIAKRKRNAHFKARIKGEIKPKSAEHVTFGDLFDLVDLRWQREGKQRRIRQFPLLEPWKKLRVRDYSDTFFEKWRQDLLDRGIQPPTIDKTVEVIRRGYTLGHEHTPRYVYEIPKLSLLRTGKRRKGYIAPATFLETLLPTIRELDANMGDFFEYFYWVGTRPSEIAALTVPMLNTTAGPNGPWILTIPPEIRKQREEQTMVLLPHTAIRRVMERRLACKRMETPYLFWRMARRKGKEGPRKIRDNYWYEIFKDALAKHPELPQKLMPYDVRRSAVTNMVNDYGLNIVDAQALTGILSLEILKGYIQDKSENAARKLFAAEESGKAQLGENNAVDFAKARAKSGNK